MPNNWADADLAGVDLVLLERVELGPRVGHPALDRRSHLGAQLVGVEVAVGADADGGEPVPQLLLARAASGRTASRSSRISKNCGDVVCWSGVSGGTKSMAGAGGGGGWFRNTDSGAT